MKLLCCMECTSIFNLSRKLKTCDCGKVKGHYLKNGWDAVTNGKGVCLAIGNGSFLSASREVLQGVKEKSHFLAWVRPHTGLTNPRTKVDPDL